MKAKILFTQSGLLFVFLVGTIFGLISIFYGMVGNNFKIILISYGLILCGLIAFAFLLNEWVNM